MTLRKTAVKAAALISLSLLFVLSACGELSSSLFSSGGTYQVRALVNGNSLESCSIIRQDDKIIPYFAVSVVNDPDLMGLLVYLKNSKGDIAGERVLYTIEPVEDATQPETPQEKIDPEDPEDNENESDNEKSETGEPEIPRVTEKRTVVDTKPVVKKYDTAIVIKSFGQEMPFFPLPKNLEIGPYSLVFEAVGRSNTLSLTETDIFYLGNVDFRLNDISMYLPWFSDTRLIPPGAPVMLETGLDFDSRLNPYVIWYNGRNVISEGRISEGAGNILWKAPEQPGFYSLRVEVLPFHLKRNFTGIFREITIPVSAKASQTGYLFGNGPDYPAKRPLTAGTVYAEQARLAAALAANTDKTAVAPILPKSPELLRWYRFDGNLDEANSLPELMFETANDKVPSWAAAGQSYGLSVGPDDSYFLRPVKFFRQTQDQEGGGIFLFHVRPVAEGTVFSAFFPLIASANDGVWMDIATRENVITLRLKTKGASVEMPVNMANTSEQGLIPIVVEFYIRPYRLEAKLSLGEDLSMQSITGEIRLPGALTGDGRIRLGPDKTAPANASAAATKSVLVLTKPSETETAADIPVEALQPESTEKENKTPVVTVTALTTIWDELAVLSSSTPLLPEEILVDIDPDSVETEDAQTPAVETRKEVRAALPPAERAKPNTAPPKPAVNVKPAEKSAPVENEALTETKTGAIPVEQEPAETEDEEAAPLISLP